MIRAFLFDMDGLLIDSERIYTEVTNEVLHTYGKGSLPWSIKAKLQGLPGTEASRVLLEWAQLPISPEKYYEEQILRLQKHWNETKFMPGALELLRRATDAGIPIALATSSATTAYQLKTNHLRDGFDLFGTHVVTGDDPRIPPGRGKPAPDIWLVALQSLNDGREDPILPEECIVFEDGIPGVRAGRSAGASIVWVPDPRILAEFHGKKQEIVGAKGQILASLEEFQGKQHGLSM